MVKSIFKENKEKLMLKRMGHSLIDKIKWKGYSMTHVYKLLAQELGIAEEHAHFGRMNAVRELRAAYEALKKLEARLPKTAYASKGYKPKPEITEGARIIRLQDQPKLQAVTIKLRKIRPQTIPKKVGKRLAQKKANTLPRAEMLKALEDMRLERLKKEQPHFFDEVSGEIKPSEWVYTKGAWWNLLKQKIKKCLHVLAQLTQRNQ